MAAIETARHAFPAEWIIREGQYSVFCLNTPRDMLDSCLSIRRLTVLHTIILSIHIGSAIGGFILATVLGVWIVRRTDISQLSRAFWRWQRTLQWITVVLGLAGATLYLEGKRPMDPLHLLYGALALMAVLLLGAFAPNRDPKDLLQGWQVNPKWVLFGLNVFLWAMYGRGLTTGFFGF